MLWRELTVKVVVEDWEAAQLPPPEYSAWTTKVPAEAVVQTQLAIPPLKLDVVQRVLDDASLKTTVPVAEVGDTVAVNVKFLPTVVSLDDEVNETVFT